MGGTIREKGKRPYNFAASDLVIVNKENDFNCPNCNKHSGAMESMIASTEAEFVEAPDPHYKWEEIHKCVTCHTMFQIENGT